MTRIMNICRPCDSSSRIIDKICCCSDGRVDLRGQGDTLYQKIENVVIGWIPEGKEAEKDVNLSNSRYSNRATR